MNATEEYATRLAKVLIYRQNINSCEFPDEMEKLLEAYLKDGDPEVEETIESQYEIDIIKKASFQAGSMYGDMNTFGGKIRQFCISHKLGWIYKHPIILIALLIWILITGYNDFFRYDYQLYNMPGKYEYRVKAVRLDKLTGKVQLIIVNPATKKQPNEVNWDEVEEVEKE